MVEPILQEVKIQCVRCKEDYIIGVFLEDLIKYKEGVFVQDAFPYLSADSREMFISRICPVCQDKMFGEDE